MASTPAIPDRRPLALAALLVGLTAIAYLPTLSNGFVWDDDTSLTLNRFVKSADGLRQFWLTTHTPDYWPVTATTFWIEWRLWGMNALGYHATNLSLHIIEVLMLWSILRRIRLPGAGLAALLFAVHPVNVESVAWVTQRKNLMAMLFFLASIQCFLRTKWSGFGEEAATDRPSRSSAGEGWYWLGFAAFVLALLSKGSVAILPVVMLGFIAWNRRVGPRDLVRVAPFLVAAGVLTLVDIWFQKHYLAPDQTVRAAGLVERALGAGAVVWFYLGKALLPIDLTFIYPVWHIGTANPLWWLPLPAAIGLAVVLGWKARLRPSGRDAANFAHREIWRGALFAWGYFCVALLPVMGFADIYFMQFSLVADHYQHLALIGIAALAGAGWAGWRSRSAWAAWTAAILAVAALAGLTWRQCLNYRDAETLFEATLRNNPGSPLAHNNLGVIFADQHRLREAEAQFEVTLRLAPGSAGAQHNFGLALAREGRWAEAIPRYEQALRLKPDFVNAHDDLGIALMRLGREGEAIPQFEAAIGLNPDDAEAHCNLGIALVRVDRLAEAAAQFEAALRLDPDNANTRSDLANTLMHSGRLPEAIAQFEEILQSHPDDAGARSDLEAARRALHNPSP
jgi:protein O-mannosyl-transferase